MADDFAVGRDVLSQEGWLRETSLPHVEGLFTGKEPFSENDFGTLHDDAAMMFADIADEKVLDEVGVVELKDVAIEDLNMDKVTVASGVVGHGVSGVLTEHSTGDEARKKRRPCRVGCGGTGADVECGCSHGGLCLRV